eukprot:9482987-Pyramimonas_sp.AAC.1
MDPSPAHLMCGQRSWEGITCGSSCVWWSTTHCRSFRAHDWRRLRVYWAWMYFFSMAHELGSGQINNITFRNYPTDGLQFMPDGGAHRM